MIDRTKLLEAIGNKAFFKVQEVADLLRVNHKTLREELRNGTIDCKRIGRTIRIPRKEVLDLLGLS